MADGMTNGSEPSERTMRCILRDTHISAYNKKLILRYQQEMFANGLSPRRITRKLFDLKGICDRWLQRSKKLDKLTTADVRHIVAQIEKSDYAEYTRSGFKITLRSFFHWLRGGGPIPEEVAWYKTGVKRCQQKLPEDVLTEEEVERMVGVQQRARERALISVFLNRGAGSESS